MTEQCSVDSLLPKNRTETFARQLQHRLRTLNGESDRDGPEDTSWTGDQLSSSSDDIYYDVDSFPGSPVEVATETEYKDYINVNKKSSDSVCQSSPTNNCLIHELSLQDQPKDCVDCTYLEQYPRHDSINNCSSGVPSYCLSPLEREFISCEQCSTRNKCNGISVPSDKEKINHFSSSSTNFDILSEPCISQNDELISTNRNGVFDDVTRINCLNKPLKADNECREPPNIDNYCNGIENIHIKDEFCTYVADHIVNDKEIGPCNCETEPYFKNCGLCYESCDKKSFDVNGNSSANNNDVLYSHPIDTEVCENSITPETGDTEGRCEKAVVDSALGISESSFNNDNDCLYKDEKCVYLDNYTEEDLTRLVDSVFLKSQEKDFDIVECCDNITTNEKDSSADKSAINYEDAEETIESKRSRLRRCSSLKSGKTPPGTPACKKIVRFADVLGLDLTDIRTFLDEIPKVPKSAFTDLKDCDLSSSPPVHMSGIDSFMGRQVSPVATKPERSVVPLFQQPSGRPEFLDRVRDNFVCLENCVVSDATLFLITGLVRVKNIGFHKTVHVRYSIDSWKSFADLQATYIPNSCDGFSDKFKFVLYAHMLDVGQRLEFAVRYHGNGSQFWDNNRGANYAFQCVPSGPVVVAPPSYGVHTPMETWASFY